MKIIVTGAAGFVGHHLVAALRRRGDDVTALALPREDATLLEHMGAEIARGDVRAPETLVEPLRGADVIFHLAAIHGLWRPKDDYYSVNVTGTENVCRAALAAGVRRLIYASSWTVYGMGLRGIIDESFPLHPMFDFYAVTKAEAEGIVRRYSARDGLCAVIVRPGTMFGPGDTVNFGRMADRLRAGKAMIIGSGRNFLPFVYVSDVVDGMILAAEREQAVGQAYNLGHDAPLTQDQMWSAVARELGLQAPRLRVPYWPLYVLALLAERAVGPDQPRRQPLVTRLGVTLFGADNRHSIAKARRELGYAPRVPVSEGVRIAAQWYQREIPAASGPSVTTRVAPRTGA